MKVYTSPNLTMVAHLRNVLEMNGIACEIRNEFLGALVVGMISSLLGPQLWVVEASQVEEAKRLIAEALAPSEHEAAHWKCPGCDEELEGQFTLCWNCGTNRPDDRDAEPGPSA